jgi:oligosaccharyltransferase complex subunit beta
MLDPHLRIPLTARRLSETRQRFEAKVTLPDRHGVFTLRVDHRRPGWSSIETATVISITPPRHDEYERFIRGAAPYYGGALSVSVGLLAFVFFWVAQS